MVPVVVVVWWLLKKGKFETESRQNTQKNVPVEERSPPVRKAFPPTP
jgi:hypothetical protein